MLPTRSIYLALLLLCRAPGSLYAGPDAAQGTDVPQEANLSAVAPLERMREYLVRTPDLEFETSFSSTTDLPGMSRQGTAHFFIRQPNSFRVELHSNKGDYVFVSDGKTFILHRPAEGTFARVFARDTIIGTMYVATGLLGTQARLIDFLWTVNYGDRVKVTARGTEVVDGKSCDHVSVDRFENAWDVWLEQSQAALPCRLRSRKSDANDRSVQTNEFRWIKNPTFTSDTFAFTPPAGSREVGVSDLE